MGQRHGKAAYIKAAAPFVNASEKDVNKLWEAFNDVAEGFGLNQDETCEIARSLMATLEIHAKADMDQLTTPLFTAMDTDENGLIDALEFLGTMAVMSAMTIAQKLTFVYNCYDFNESGQISIDELTLALRSTLTGLCKLTSGVVCPTEMVLEDLALHAFHKSQKHGVDDFITLPEFLRFAETTPEMTSWIDYFDCPNELLGDQKDQHDDSDLELEEEQLSAAAVRPLDEEAATKRDPSFPFDAKKPAFLQDVPVTVQPWQAVVANMAPSAPPTVNPNAPAASLELDWIYGMNSDLRSVVQYVTPHEIVFPAGAVAVLYDTIEHKQRFACHHADLVTCLAIHPLNRHVIASGERGLLSPKIVVWSTQSLATTLAVVRGFHRVGISHVAWMPHGRTLISVGQDPFHCIAVYQWEAASSASSSSSSIVWSKPATLVFADRCGTEPVYACVVASATQFVTCGRRHLFFWSRESDARYTSGHALYYKRRGVLGRKTKVQTLLSLAAMPSDPHTVLAGSARGQILVFEGRNCVRVVHAHASSVTVLQAFPGGILSGGRDGKVRLWSKRMEPGAQFDLEALGSVSSRVRSLVASPDGGAKLLIATSGAEVFEIAASDGSNLHFGAMLCGHFAFELHGLATHPTKREFATSGDDRSVRVWDMATHRQVRMVRLDAPSRACAYSPDGSLLAIGQGAEEEEGGLTKKRLGKLVNVNKQGAFAVLSEATLALKYEAKDSKKWIRTIGFSGDGLTCAVGSSDAFIYSYNTDDWASRGKCKARDTSVVLSHVDFSSTGEYIMANAVNKREMVFFETSSGVEITRIATLKDVDWLTTTCPFGWAVQGAWATQQSQYYEISAVARASSGAGPPLLAVGDADGGLRLFRFPCVSPLAVAHTATRAASSRLSRVVFSSDSAFVVAAAQDERCVFQWRVEYEEQDFAATLHREDGVTPAGPTAGGVAEFEYHATSDDEVERSHGDERSLFDEAAAAGDFAVELLGGMEDPGDETTAATPVKPWVASAIAPTDVPFDDKDPERSTVPHESLELEWVYGYRCHDARNNVFSSRAKSWLVYPAARVVVVLDTKLWLQRHFKQHTDEVTAVAVFLGTKKKKGGSASRPPTSEESTRADETTSTTWLGSAEVVASGQMGNVPVIHVWKLDTLEVVASLRGLHRRGIAELRFNGTGNLLVSIGLDPHHTLAVYDWQSGVVLGHAATRAGPGRVMGVAFQQQTEPAVGLMLCTVGVQQLTFWRLSSTHQLLKKDALMGKKGLLQTFLSVVYCGKDAVVGTTSGDLYRFKGIELASIVPAHQRSVAALVCLPQPPFQLASGGHDGLVKLWSADLECLAEFGEFNPPKHAVRSVWWDFDKNLLVVGTRGAAIHLLSSLDGSPVTPKTPDGSLVTAMDGHYRHELHGLSVCASKDRFCTTGDDATLRVWDMARHLQILSKALDTASRACAYSWDGDVIAVGLGGGHAAKRHKKDGSLLVFEDRGASVELVYETRDTKQSVSALAFSPDGASLVVGSLDNSVYVYDVPNNYAKRAVFAKHKSWITGVDISSDSQYVRSTCGGCELLFSDITTGSHVASATALRNQTWATCSTVFNWSNQGAWPVASRSSITASAASAAGNATDAVLAVGTSHGAVHLLKFPSVTKGAGFKSFAGHHGAVAKLAFSGRSAQCISIGTSDRCVLQWRKTRASEEAPPTGIVKDLDADDAIVLEGLFIPEAFQNLPAVDIKPYVSAIMPPTIELPEPTASEGDAATVKFELEHVFGVRLHDVRNNAAYAKTKHVLFHTGRLGVQYDRRTHTQRFYRGHARPIVSLAVGGDFVATGEICSEHLQRERPRIHIWEPASCACVCVLSAFHTKAVAYVAFDTTRRLLASVGQDEFHSLAVYSSPSGLWFDGALLASAKTTRQQVYFVAPLEDPSSPFQLATGGHDHVTFWRLDAPSLVATRGMFGTKGQPQPQLCGGSIASLLVTGCLTGHLYVWESGVVARAVPAHDEAVYALHATPHGCVTGGRDGKIKIWSATVTPVAEFNLLDATPAVQHPSVRSVHWDVAEDRVLIGTRGGELLELSRLTNSTSLVTESHFDPSQLVALSAHPQRPELVATAGEDHTVRVWDLETREVLVKLTLDGPLRSVAFAPDGKTLAVGFGSEAHAAKDGAFVVLDAVTLEIRHEGRDAKQSILAIAFSPDLTLLALGGADHCVYVYSTLDAYALRFKFHKVNGRVLHLDFAADSSALRLNSDAYELLYVSTLDGAAIAAPSSMKDAQWASHSCVFTWTTQGLWDAARDGEYVHAVAKAHTRPLLASATNTGQVRVYNFPCLSRSAEQHVLTGHALHVSGVAFTCDDARLVSIGAHDKSLLVWKLAPAK